MSSAKNNFCLLLNDETLLPLAQLWGVHEESLIRLSKEADAGYFEKRKVSWQQRLKEIEGELACN